MDEKRKTNQLKPSKHNPRKTWNEEELQNMAETFKTQGVINPIEIDEDNNIITGELRWRATQIAGIKEIPVKILKGLTEEEKRFRQFVENFQRQNLKPQEYIPELKKLYEKWSNLGTAVTRGRSIDKGYSEFAKQIGMGESWIRSILQLEEKAITPVIKAMDKEEISVTAATEIAQAPKKMQTQLLKNVKEAGKKLTVPEIRKQKKDIERVERFDKIRKGIIPDEKTPEDYADYLCSEMVSLWPYLDARIPHHLDKELTIRILKRCEETMEKLSIFAIACKNALK